MGPRTCGNCHWSNDSSSLLRCYHNPPTPLGTQSAVRPVVKSDDPKCRFWMGAGTPPEEGEEPNP